MTLSPGWRKAGLTVHVACSVGWLGSVAAFLALAVVGMTSQDEQRVRGVYLAMEVLGEAVVVPLALAAVGSGVLQALSTAWGLVRHYWVVVKLALTIAATAVLLAYRSTVASLAEAAAAPEPLAAAGVLPSASPVLHSAGALVVLIAALVLSVFKPRGVTPYGWRRLQQPQPRP